MVVLFVLVLVIGGIFAIFMTKDMYKNPDKYL